MGREEILERERASRPFLFKTIGAVAVEGVIAAGFVMQEASEGHLGGALRDTLIGGAVMLLTGAAAQWFHDRRD